jgi:hypothetical protein
VRYTALIPKTEILAVVVFSWCCSTPRALPGTVRSPDNYVS